MLKRKEIKKIKKELEEKNQFECLNKNIENYTIPKTFKEKPKKKKKKKKKKKPQGYIIYKEYIRSALWRKRREEYYKKNKKKCVICGSKYNVGLHHISYKRLGNEKDNDLVPLCWFCHFNYHEKHGKGSVRTTMRYIEDSQEFEEFRQIVKNL